MQAHTLHELIAQNGWADIPKKIIPGNPKGEAVRMEDDDKGPLHRTLELPLLINAMRNDKSQKLEHLQQKAATKGFAKYLDYFKGRIVDDASDAINGERDDKHLSFINENNPTDQTEIGICGENNICHLDPPFSCYLCPKFQPYRHADHEHVLECLLNSRNARMKKYENARLGIQLGDVIFAVAQVAAQCKSEVSNG